MNLSKSKLSLEEIVRLYKAKERMKEIANLSGLSRHTVLNWLKAAGVVEKDRKIVVTTCPFCGERFRQKWSRQRVHCSHQCHGAMTGAAGRYNERLSALTSMHRRVEGGVKHYINGDQWDDRPENVRLFDSHEEHIAWHWQNR